jgi:hypothetical protein
MMNRIYHEGDVVSVRRGSVKQMQFQQRETLTGVGIFKSPKAPYACAGFSCCRK